MPYTHTLALCLFCLLCAAGSGAQSLLWSRHYGGPGDDIATCAILTQDGGSIVVGRSTSASGDVPGNSGGFDAWAIKLNETGGAQWSRHYGGSGTDAVAHLHQMADGAYLMAGRTASADGDLAGNYGGSDAWLLKVAATGELLWSRHYGGTGFDELTMALPTPDGGYIAAGRTESADGDLPGSYGGSDLWVMRTDGAGGLLWSRHYGGTGEDRAQDIRATADGGYIVAGVSNFADGDVPGNNGGLDYWLLKLDGQGELAWSRHYGGSGNDVAKAVVPQADGGYLLAGHSDSPDGDVAAPKGGIDYWLLRTDSLGQITWQGSYGGSGTDQLEDLWAAADGGCLLAGQSNSPDGQVGGTNGGLDYWLVKTDSLGVLTWQQHWGGNNAEYARSVREIEDGRYLLGGYSASSSGDLSGNYGGFDYWVAVVSTVVVQVEEDGRGAESIPALVYPNPLGGSGTMVWRHAAAAGGFSVRLFDAVGHLVWQSEGSGNRVDLSLGHLPGGVYFFEAVARGGAAVSRGRVVRLAR